MYPFISIIIPVYNVEHYLRECLDSILNWQFVEWEAIIVDDGSTDNSGSICDGYANNDARFKVIHKQNEGVSVARNTGLDIARGQWCWFVDADDVIDIHTPVNTSLLEDKDLVIYDSRTYFDGNSPPLVDEGVEYDICRNLDEFFSRWVSYTHPTHWYSRKFWDKRSQYHIRFTKGIKLGEDLEFMRKCEILSKAPIKIMHTNYYYRLRQGSATRNGCIHHQVVSDTFMVLENIYEFITTYNLNHSSGLLHRFINLAVAIPAHAVRCGLWNKPVSDNFKVLVNKYEALGLKLTTSRYIWLSVKIPWALNLLHKILR